MVARVVIAGTLIVASLGLAAEIARSSGAPEEIVEIFSLSYEGNVPTWWASVLLFSCGLALASIARSAERSRAHWWALAIGFFYMSLDEAVQLHEELGRIFGEGEGVLYFTWVIPAAAIVIVLGIAFVPFLRALDPRTRLRFVAAGAIYVGGAVAMELPLGWWADAYGEDSLGYALIDFTEETLELIGTNVFLLALLSYRGSS